MKNLFKGNKYSWKIVLALIALAGTVVKSCAPAPAEPHLAPANKYHLEASYAPGQGGKVVFDKH